MKIFSFLSKKFLIYAGLGLVLVIAIYIGFRNGNEKQTAIAAKADVISEVAASGKVKPNQSVNLGFDKSGRVANVYAAVGEEVKMGQTVATLEAGEVSSDLLKAKALLMEENAKLREIKSTAPISYNDASKNLDAAVREGFADTDNAVRNKADQFFKTPSTNPQLGISIVSGNFTHYFNVPTDLELDINSKRRKAEEILVDWQKRVSNNNASNLVSEADKAISDMKLISQFLDKMAEAINTFSPADFAYETTVNNYKSAISVARSDVSGAISDVVAAKDKLNSAPTLGQGGEFEDVLSQEAKVAQAQAAVSSLEASLGKSLIRAPFDGVVTLQDAKPGAAVSAGATLVSVISQNEMYIEANISEIHIGKLSAGNPVSVTFDAFPDEVFAGEVSYIEPGDVLIDGVVNYKVRVNLKNPNARIKSGLTANLEIETAKKENVLAIPLYAVSKEGSQNFVNKVVGNKTQKVPVTLGLSGSNGSVEIVAGLNEGDMVEF